jgi:hypothetical protein
LIIIVQVIYEPVIQAQEVLLIFSGPTAGLTPSDTPLNAGVGPLYLSLDLDLIFLIIIGRDLLGIMTLNNREK